MEGPLRLITTLVVLFGVVYVMRKIRLAYNDLRKIPGPLLSRFTNLPLKLRVLTGQRTNYIHALHQEYATSKQLAQIHRIGTPFQKAAWYQNQAPTQYDDETCGVFGIRDQRKAAARRKLFQQAGTKAAVLQWEPIIVRIVEQAVEKIKRDALNGRADVMKWWTMMTADVLGTLAFGDAFRMIEKEEKPQLIHDIEVAMICVGIRMEMPIIWHILNIIPFPGLGRPIEIANRLRSAGGLAVQNTKSAPKGSTKTLFSKMYPEDGSQPFSDSLMADEAGNIIIAGSDTTAMALTYLVYRVLLDPEIKKKLLDELATCSPNPGWEELEAKQYLNNVIQETLRMYPPVPASLPRVSPKADQVLCGYNIPAGTIVDTQAWTLHRNPRVFPDPERFNPDRWLHPTSEMKDSFMTFGGSARVCLGQNVARLELLHAVSKFFRECHCAQIAEGTTSKSMEIIDFFVLKPAAGKFDITLNWKAPQDGKIN